MKWTKFFIGLILVSLHFEAFSWTPKTINYNFPVTVTGSGTNTIITIQGPLASSSVKENLCLNKDMDEFYMSMGYAEANTVFYDYFDAKVWFSTNNSTWTQLPLNAFEQIPITSGFINRSSKLYLRIQLTPKSNAIYNADSIDLNGKTMINFIINCSYRAYKYHQFDTYQYQHTTGSVIASGGTITLNKTCSITNDTQTVKLSPVFVNTLNSSNEVYGGKFPISLNCSNATVSNAYITVTDGNTPANTTQLLSLSADSGAEGVKLKIYPEGQTTPLTYGPAPTEAFYNSAKAISFASNVNQQATVTKNFTVYYVKDGTATAGTANGKMIYNMYYR